MSSIKQFLMLREVFAAFILFTMLSKLFLYSSLIILSKLCLKVFHGTFQPTKVISSLQDLLATLIHLRVRYLGIFLTVVRGAEGDGEHCIWDEKQPIGTPCWSTFKLFSTKEVGRVDSHPYICTHFKDRCSSMSSITFCF